MTTPLPESISRQGSSMIEIRWDDGQLTRWTAAQLRSACPCATCREKNRAEASSGGSAVQSESPKSMGLPVLSSAEARPLEIESMRPVGNYAYNISFSDGHSSGLFQLDMLHEGPS